MFRRNDGDLASDVLTKNQLAKEFQVCSRSVENFVRQGKLPAPFYVSSRTPRWSRRVVSEWIARAAEKAATAAGADVGG